MPEMDPAKRMFHIRDDFAKRSSSYEADIVNIVPNYLYMLEAAVGSIPFDVSAAIKTVDLGTGTGSLAIRVKDRFPNCHLLCVDMTEGMLNMARERFSGLDGIEFLQKDFYELALPPERDLVVSSLALRHLITDDDKRTFYRKICECLRPEGVFVNADAVLSADDDIEALYERKWRKFMLDNLNEKEVDDAFERYRREDSLPYLHDELKWLSEAGFSKVDVIWKDHMGAVRWARK
ncbi:MAG: class I SAM-dependent methyltransferase [Euryarchaeota archaeon]|nr:class I SAM-dependent methyltransferase [Euryarchaeota archaeon]